MRKTHCVLVAAQVESNNALTSFTLPMLSNLGGQLVVRLKSTAQAASDAAFRVLSADCPRWRVGAGGQQLRTRGCVATGAINREKHFRRMPVDGGVSLRTLFV